MVLSRCEVVLTLSVTKPRNEQLSFLVINNLSTRINQYLYLLEMKPFMWTPFFPAPLRTSWISFLWHLNKRNFVNSPLQSEMVITREKFVCPNFRELVWSILSCDISRPAIILCRKKSSWTYCSHTISCLLTTSWNIQDHLIIIYITRTLLCKFEHNFVYFLVLLPLGCINIGDWS